jgi:curved DNA-binding protein CbpA
MPDESARTSKRALITVMLALAAAYGILLACVRDSPDDEVLRAYRKLLLRVHPDKGGTTADQQRLQGAKEAWDAARRRRPGRPKAKAKAKAKPKPRPKAQ